MKSQGIAGRTVATAVAAVAAAVMLMPAANAAAPVQGVSTAAQTAASVTSESGKPQVDIVNGAIFDRRSTTNYDFKNVPPDDGVFVRLVNKTDAPVRIKVKDSKSRSEVTLEPGKVMWVAGFDSNENSVYMEVHSEAASWGTVWFNDPWFWGDNPEGGFSYHDRKDQDDFTEGMTRGMSNTVDRGSFKLTMDVLMTLKGTPESLGWSENDLRSVGHMDAGGNISTGCHKDWQVFDLDIRKMSRHY